MSRPGAFDWSNTVEVPPIDHPNIIEFANSLNGKSFIIDVDNKNAGPHSRCYWNAQKTSQAEGSEVVYGWLVVWRTGRFIHAIHHAVVRLNGILRDVTLPNHNDTSVHFIETGQSLSFDTGERIPKKIKILSDIKQLHDWRLMDLEYEMVSINRTEASYRGDFRAMARLDQHLLDLRGAWAAYEHRALLASTYPDEACPCLSGKSFAECHKKSVGVVPPADSYRLLFTNKIIPADKGGRQAVRISSSQNQAPERRPIGRNDLCHCGSGKKYKRCHGG